MNIQSIIACGITGFICALGVFWASHGKLISIPVSATLPNGMIYTGEIVDGVFDGPGELKGIGKERYLGHFVAGRLEGEGEYWDSAGNYIKGEFVQGAVTGKGVLQYIDGSVYTGDFVAGEMKGLGELQSPQGRHYVGEFSRDLFHGNGKFSESEDDWFEGTFEYGEIVEGISESSFGRYEGAFKNWLFNGKGVYTSQDGVEYKGDFVDGAFTGKGTIIESDGSRYEGEVLDWSPNGEGVKTESNGNVYTGTFEYGMYQGKGVMILAEPVNGLKIVQGHWEWGTLKDDPRDPLPLDKSKTEALLYSQNALLQSTLNDIDHSVKGRPELYMLGVAGYGKQDVFLKEVRTIKSIFDHQPYSPGRSAYLINHYDTSSSYPLATVTALETVLNGMGQKMDVDEDILFLYMTSHGSKTRGFSVSLEGIKLPYIQPEQLAETLKSSGIQWKVVVISACYSGGFIPALKDENTMIMTSAKENRKSFGCGDNSEMTYFGDAYFNHALPAADSFSEAFAHARKLIFDWEGERHPDAEYSEPQIYIGEAIAKQLKIWRHSEIGGKRLPKRRRGTME